MRRLKMIAPIPANERMPRTIVCVFGEKHFKRKYKPTIKPAPKIKDAICTVPKLPQVIKILFSIILFIIGWSDKRLY
jgi:hypothetical protein